MDVSKKISAYPEKFFTLILVCIDALRAVMYMPSPSPSPGPSRRALPPAGSWWSIFGRIRRFTARVAARIVKGVHGYGQR